MKLQQLIEQYIAFRQALGERFIAHAGILRAFARAMGTGVEVTAARPEPVSDFLRGTGPITSSWHVRYTVLRGFYCYAITRGYATVAPLPTAVPKRPPAFVPYIYSQDELRRLLAATEATRHPRRRVEPYTLRTILLVLYGAGLRVSEAENLAQVDVDLVQALATIRNSKFGKSRLVPLAPQLVPALQGYASWRDAHHPAIESPSHFFVGRDSKPLRRLGLEVAFRLACIRAGVVRQDGARYQPRLHDLRHTFAVHRLLQWYQQGANVQILLPQLSAYLGHRRLCHTQVYLSMTPELLQQASARFACYAQKEDDHD
jgi:site-specific recombinase XerD